MPSGFELFVEKLVQIFSAADKVGEEAIMTSYGVMVRSGMDPQWSLFIACAAVCIIFVMVIKKLFKYIAAGIAIAILIMTLSETNIISDFINENQENIQEIADFNITDG